MPWTSCAAPDQIPPPPSVHRQVTIQQNYEISSHFGHIFDEHFNLQSNRPGTVPAVTVTAPALVPAPVAPEVSDTGQMDLLQLLNTQHQEIWWGDEPVTSHLKVPMAYQGFG